MAAAARAIARAAKTATIARRVTARGAATDAAASASARLAAGDLEGYLAARPRGADAGRSVTAAAADAASRLISDVPALLEAASALVKRGQSAAVRRVVAALARLRESASGAAAATQPTRAACAQCCRRRTLHADQPPQLQLHRPAPQLVALAPCLLPGAQVHLVAAAPT